MTASRQIRFWLIGAVVAGLFVWLLRDMLLPFVAGLAIAYFLNPLTDRIEKLVRSRTLATIVLVIIATLVGVGLLLAIVPLVSDQLATLARKLPEYTTRLYARLLPLLQTLQERFGIDAAGAKDFESVLSARAGDALRFVGAVLGSVVTSGFALVNLLALLFLTPVIAFYLMRDWPKLVATVDGYLPRAHADTIRGLMRDANTAVAGYVRGQATVCLVLAFYYGTALALVGLDFGLIIGIIIGLISFIPYVGSFTGGVLAIGMALAQFPPDWLSVGKVVAVFAVGQFLEGNVLAPKLVGDSIGIHPVWLMFALLAGGTLFGFVGLLLSVPVAAVAGVLVRFALREYRDSAYYRGTAERVLLDTDHP
ncbi:AI-2E family transporter [Vineibacter terrae]|uniref:AI-2E family transporter n=1 Tax=Vineibacter terrae TaxID=2586908 RepID=UPI002E2FA87D|nr:AI-2E family transporter [Vineibacter terrae]HEX2885584.1 AI-2E family transporter [Vineibacter terrae]